MPASASAPIHQASSSAPVLQPTLLVTRVACTQHVCRLHMPGCVSALRVVSVCLQLNMRKLLEDSKLPAINVICQKVATEGLTRFEDRHRLPLGISVNLNSFAAKMLAQVRGLSSA